MCCKSWRSLGPSLESSEQALLALHLTHKDAQKIEALETNNRDILVRYQEGSILAATNRRPQGRTVDRTKAGYAREGNMKRLKTEQIVTLWVCPSRLRTILLYRE